MSDIKNLDQQEAIKKLRDLAEEIDICMFCTNLTVDDGATCRPMSTQQVCEQGNIWFFSEVNSIKNREIEQHKQVQLFYSHPDKNSYMVVNGEAEIVFDKNKTEELWTKMAEMWFEEGKDDPTISLIKVKPTSAYYWDIDGNKMVNFFKMIAFVTSGTNLISSKEGELDV
jgi:general stress protein 26